MYSDFFTKPLQRKTFQQFRDIKQVIPKITLDVDINFPRAVDNVTPQESVGQNDRQTHKIATASTYAHRIMCTDKQKNGIKSKDDCGIMCTDTCGITRTDVSTESTGVHGSMCLYIYTEGTGMHRVTSTEDSTINTVVQGRMNAYDKYGRCEPK